MIIDLDCSVGATSRIQWAETTAPLNISAHVLEAGVAAKGRLGTSPGRTRSDRGKTRNISAGNSHLCASKQLREGVAMGE
jgi:hypothetical protein